MKRLKIIFSLRISLCYRAYAHTYVYGILEHFNVNSKVYQCNVKIPLGFYQINLTTKFSKSEILFWDALHKYSDKICSKRTYISTCVSRAVYILYSS